MTRPAHVGNEREEKRITIGEQFHLIIIKGKSQIVVDEQFHHLLVSLGHLHVVLIHKAEHRAAGELVETTLTDQFVPARVDTEEQVEHQSHHGHEIYDHGPCHRLHRLAIVYQHMYYRHHLYYLVYHYENDMQSVHFNLLTDF